MKSEFLAGLCALSLFAYSCVSDDLSDRVSSLDERVAALEQVFSEINDNATALNVLYRENLLITKYKSVMENGITVGYDIIFSNGKSIRITYGKSIEGVAPMIGFNDMGQWTVSYDGGKTFEVISGSAAPDAEDGVTPRVNVDKYGFWIYSMDGGKTWERVLNSAGEPMSAVDGKSHIPSSYCFFSNVSYNKETGNMDISLVDGRSFSIPVEAEASIVLKYYDPVEGAYVYGNRLNEFPAEITGINEALFIDVPEGWDAWFEGSNLVVDVPSDYKDGTYNLKLLASTVSAQPKAFEFKFKYEKDLILFDDFLGSDIDYRWWQRYVHGTVTNDWNRYQDGAPEESVVEDGLLKLYAHLWGDSYRTGAIWTKEKLTYKPPFRVDCRARFTDMGTGIWYAIWVVPETSYMYGEIDICEKLNFGTLTYHTVHTMYTLNTAKEHQNKETYVDDQGRTVSNSNQGKAQSAMVAGEFNTFSVEVTDDQIVFYVNDIPVHRYLHFVHSVEDPVYSQLKDSEKEVYLQNWPFMEQDYNTILDVAVGGQFVGGVIKDDEFPGQFDIDWIKVKQL